MRHKPVPAKPRGKYAAASDEDRFNVAGQRAVRGAGLAFCGSPIDLSATCDRCGATSTSRRPELRVGTGRAVAAARPEQSSAAEGPPTGSAACAASGQRFNGGGRRWNHPQTSCRLPPSPPACRSCRPSAGAGSRCWLQAACTLLEPLRQCQPCAGLGEAEQGQ